jgi:hypothetical protein
MSSSPLPRRRGPPLTTPVPGARGAPSAVMFVEMLIYFLGLAWASSHLAALPVPDRTEPFSGMVPPRDSRSSTTPPEESSTASTPEPGSVLVPKSGVNRISSLSSVQVKSCLGCSVGLSPPSPPQPRISPGFRLRPSTSRVAPSDEEVAVVVSERAAMSVPSPEPGGRCGCRRGRARPVRRRR